MNREYQEKTNEYFKVRINMSIARLCGSNFGGVGVLISVCYFRRTESSLLLVCLLKVIQGRAKCRVHHRMISRCAIATRSVLGQGVESSYIHTCVCCWQDSLESVELGSLIGCKSEGVERRERERFLYLTTYLLIACTKKYQRHG